MIVKKQKQITFLDKTSCRVDLEELKSAILWYSNKPVCRLKTIFMYGKYPAVSIYDKKIHIHRLLAMYWQKSELERWQYVHHLDGNKLNNLRENLEILIAPKHQSETNKGRKFSETHRQKIGEANKKRRGMKYKISTRTPTF